MMARALLEQSFNPETLNGIYAETTELQYTRKLLFSTVFALMHQVVFKLHPSIHAAYQKTPNSQIGVSLTSVYHKLNGIEASTSSALVRYSGQVVSPIIEALGGKRETWLPGFRVKLLDGNCIEGTEYRLEILRGLSSAALPEKSLVVLDPVLATGLDVFPCFDGHAQERAILPEVFNTIMANNIWIADRNFSSCAGGWKLTTKNTK
ncbi:hypothetical protein WDW89_17650 [Deltaproteobacteria bacterium TL4]